MSFQYTSSTSCVTREALVPLLVLAPDRVVTSDSPGIMVAVQVVLLPFDGGITAGAMVTSLASLQAACSASANSLAVA